MPVITFPTIQCPLTALSASSISVGRLLIKYLSSTVSFPSASFIVFRVRIMLFNPAHSFFWLSHEISSVCQYSRFSIFPRAFSTFCLYAHFSSNFSSEKCFSHIFQQASLVSFLMPAHNPHVSSGSSLLWLSVFPWHRLL